MLLLMLYCWFVVQADSFSDAGTSKKSHRESGIGASAPPSPRKRTSQRTPAGTPAKCPNITPPQVAEKSPRKYPASPVAEKSPRKYPASPSCLRAGLQSGATPQKLQKRVGSPTGVNSLLENGQHSEKRSPGKTQSSMANESTAFSLPGSPSRSPVQKRPIVVLERQEFLSGNSGSVSLLVSPTKTPVKNPSQAKLPTSPVATKTDLRSSDESAESMQSSKKQGRPRKSLIYVESSSSHATDSRSENNLEGNTTSSAVKRLQDSSSGLELEGKVLQSARHCGGPPVVIVLEDFECFSSKVLQDLITICG